MEKKTMDEILRQSTNKHLGMALDGRSLALAPSVTFDSDENLRTVVDAKGNNWMMSILVFGVGMALVLASYAKDTSLMWLWGIIGCFLAPFVVPRAWDANYKRVYVTNKRLIVTDWELRLTEFPFLHVTATQAPLELLAVVSLDGNNGLLVIPRETSVLPKTSIDRLRNPEIVIHELDAIAVDNPNRQMPARRK